ncbi:hypothetical protein BVY04_00785 [bacterium M21]|nr:hypothetical protein BVY04_00785 [bacterium M21]
MRTARQKMVGRGCWYHLINRISGPKDELLFSDVDKEVAFNLFEEVSRPYLAEIISISIMTNHFHCICMLGQSCPLRKRLRSGTMSIMAGRSSPLIRSHNPSAVQQSLRR